MRLSVRCAIAVLAGIGGLASPAPAQDGTFLVRLGRDTVAFDSYRWSGSRVEGTLLVRTPATRLFSYRGEVDASGAFTRFEASRRPAGGGEPDLTVTYEFTGDSARVTTVRNGQTETATLAARNVVPLLTPMYSMAFYERIMRQAPAAAGDTATVPILTLGSRAAGQTKVWHRGPDSLAVQFPGGAFLGTMDANGRLTGLQGFESTVKIEVARQPFMDLAPLAAGFATRDAAGTGLGPTSPRDSLAANAGGATIAVNYGRPHKRGRTVYGNLVPAGDVWRTGANAATAFITDRPLRFGDQTLPAGAYTLWTLLTPEGGTLIINGQTGQWGTQYDASKDVMRVPLQARTLPSPVEEFTIAVDPTSDGGVVRLTWDTREFSAAFKVGS
jgi:hypothetical protein